MQIHATGRGRRTTRGGEGLRSFVAAQRRQQLRAAAASVVVVNDGRRKSFRGRASGHGSLRPCAPPIDPPPPPRRPRSPTASATGDSPGEQQRRAILFHGNATSAGSNAMFGRGRMGVGLKGGGRRELNGLWRGRASLGRGTIWCIFVDERITRSSCLILEYWMRRGVDLRRFLWDEMSIVSRGRNDVLYSFLVWFFFL